MTGRVGWLLDVVAEVLVCGMDGVGVVVGRERAESAGLW